MEYLEGGIGIVFSEDSTVYVITVGDEISSEASYYVAATSDEDVWFLEETGLDSDFELVLYEAEDTTDDPTAFPVSDSLPDAGETVTIYYTSYESFAETLTMSAVVVDSEYTDSTSYVLSLDSLPDDYLLCYPMAVTDSEGNLVGIIISSDEVVPAAAIADSLASSGSSSSSSNDIGPGGWVVYIFIVVMMFLGVYFMIKQRRQQKKENLSKSASDAAGSNENTAREEGTGQSVIETVNTESEEAAAEAVDTESGEAIPETSQDNNETQSSKKKKERSKGVQILLCILAIIALWILRFLLSIW